MMAIAGSRAPDRVVNVPGSLVDGWTYKDVLQDAVDYLAFSQADPDTETSRGGWGYTQCDNRTWWDYGDRSATNLTQGGQPSDLAFPNRQPTSLRAQSLLL